MSKRKPKDKNAPKRPLSSYFIFMSERRAIMRQQHRNKPITEIAKLLAAEWRSMPIVAKSKYSAKAALLKEDYNIRLEEYKRSNNYKNYENKIKNMKKQNQYRSKNNIRKTIARNNSNKMRRLRRFSDSDSDPSSDSDYSKSSDEYNTRLSNKKRAVNTNSKENVLKTLKTMGFPANYIDKAVTKYETNHNGSYNIQNITDIIIDLQTRDNTILSPVKNSNSNNAMEYKQENKRLKNEINALEKRLEVFECTREKINRMNLDELNELKSRIQNTMQSKIQLIEEAQRKVMDNTYKCVACMDNLKNISFDECSHIALCDKCEMSMVSKRCPVCQTPYKHAKKINF